MGFFGMTYKLNDFRNDMNELERIVPLVKGMLKQADAGGRVSEDTLPVGNSVMQHNLNLMFETCKKIGKYGKGVFPYQWIFEAG